MTIDEDDREGKSSPISGAAAISGADRTNADREGDDQGIAGDESKFCDQKGEIGTIVGSKGAAGAGDFSSIVVAKGGVISSADHINAGRESAKMSNNDQVIAGDECRFVDRKGGKVITDDEFRFCVEKGEVEPEGTIVGSEGDAGAGDGSSIVVAEGGLISGADHINAGREGVKMRNYNHVIAGYESFFSDEKGGVEVEGTICGSKGAAGAGDWSSIVVAQGGVISGADHIYADREGRKMSTNDQVIAGDEPRFSDEKGGFEVEGTIGGSKGADGAGDCSSIAVAQGNGVISGADHICADREGRKMSTNHQGITADEFRFCDEKGRVEQEGTVGGSKGAARADDCLSIIPTQGEGAEIEASGEGVAIAEEDVTALSSGHRDEKINELLWDISFLSSCNIEAIPSCSAPEACTIGTMPTLIPSENIHRDWTTFCPDMVEFIAELIGDPFSLKYSYRRICKLYSSVKEPRYPPCSMLFVPHTYHCPPTSLVYHVEADFVCRGEDMIGDRKILGCGAGHILLQVTENSFQVYNPFTQNVSELPLMENEIHDELVGFIAEAEPLVIFIRSLYGREMQFLVMGQEQWTPVTLPHNITTLFYNSGVFFAVVGERRIVTSTLADPSEFSAPFALEERSGGFMAPEQFLFSTASNGDTILMRIVPSDDDNDEILFYRHNGIWSKVELQGAMFYCLENSVLVDPQPQWTTVTNHFLYSYTLEDDKLYVQSYDLQKLKRKDLCCINDCTSYNKPIWFVPTSENLYERLH